MPMLCTGSGAALDTSVALPSAPAEILTRGYRTDEISSAAKVDPPEPAFATKLSAIFRPPLAWRLPASD